MEFVNILYLLYIKKLRQKNLTTNNVLVDFSKIIFIIFLIRDEN